jgi:predicted HD phosphohydrolase
VEFCERWDQASFDPDYKNKPLEFFVDMVRDVFARPAYDENIIQKGVRKPLINAVLSEMRAE